MAYHQDPVYRTVQWLRAAQDGADSFASVYAEAWRWWSGVRPAAVRVEVELVNYKPFVRARVVAQVTLDFSHNDSPPITLRLFLHAFADEAAAHHEMAQYDAGCGSRCCGPPASYLASSRLVIWTLPNAPKLSELADLVDPVRFRDLMSRVPGTNVTGPACRKPTLVRYVPLKRALLTWQASPDTARHYIKLYNERDAAGAALTLREVFAWAGTGERGFAVPRPLHYSVALRTLIMSEVPGRPFTEIMGTGQPLPFGDVGRALAGLHLTPAVPATIWSLEQEFRDLKRHMAGVKRALPQMAKPIDTVLNHLAHVAPDLPSRPLAPIHGNLFGDQILYDDASPDSRVGLVDWDRWSLGDPHFDLGRLIAHLLYVGMRTGLPRCDIDACIARLIASYEEIVRRPVGTHPGLAWHVAAALLLRVKISSLRKLADGWPQHVEFTVEEAERILRGSCLTGRTQRGAGSTRQIGRAVA